MRALTLKDLDYSVLQQCMHCGMCLPSCPTYESTKRERHSPRGRIALMRAVADGDLDVGAELAEEMNYCLGCLACTTACPAGVDYTTMFETARAETEASPLTGTVKRRFLRWLLLNQVFLYPGRLQLIGHLLRIYQNSGLDLIVRKLKLPYLLGRSIGDLEPAAPQMNREFSDECIDLWEHPPEGVKVRGKVGMLTGCVQSLAFADVNRDTVDVLLHNGWSVFTPRTQACCGSLHAHNGAPLLARQTGENLMSQFEREFPGLDAVITNAGGCGSHLKHFSSVIDADMATQWDEKVKDIHEFLVETGYRIPEGSEAEIHALTYHESCHLCHGQGIKSQPREILDSLPAWQREELPHSDTCCGSAGIYNVLQPEESARILDRKIESIEKTSATCVVTSNPGCHLQIQGGLQKHGLDISVTQPVSLLAEAYRIQSGNSPVDKS
ncbi:MAG: (Fe-S)-binding protein [Verrucomicrobiales bacterium]|nr:(Fe-S)-binding protein [Verrucomicrobiales bacterium]